MYLCCLRLADQLILLKKVCLLNVLCVRRNDVRDTGGAMQDTGERSKDFACRFFAAEGCKLRVGAYTSLDTLCTYLESDVSAEGQAERNFWVSASRQPQH